MTGQPVNPTTVPDELVRDIAARIARANHVYYDDMPTLQQERLRNYADGIVAAVLAAVSEPPQDRETPA